MIIHLDAPWPEYRRQLHQAARTMQAGEGCPEADETGQAVSGHSLPGDEADPWLLRLLDYVFPRERS